MRIGLLAKNPMNTHMDARTIWIAYIKAVQVIFPIPHEKVTLYEILRDGEVIASIDAKDGIHPSIFDHDKHTNLFWKSSKHELFYQDEDVEPHSRHKYQVKAYRYPEDTENWYKESSVMEVVAT